MTLEECVPGGRAIYQSAAGKTYQCPFCLMAVFSQHEGDEIPLISCHPGFGVEEINGVRYAKYVGASHTLTWAQVAQK